MKTIAKKLAVLVTAASLASLSAFAVDSASDSGTNLDTGAKASADAGNAAASSLKPPEEKQVHKDGTVCTGAECAYCKAEMEKSEAAAKKEKSE